MTGLSAEKNPARAEAIVILFFNRAAFLSQQLAPLKPRMSNDAFTQLVDAHYAPLFRFAMSLTRREADACDLTQQTFYVWATKGGALRDVSKAKSWLFTTLYREFLRGRRRDQRWSSLEELPVEPADLADEEIDRVRRMDGATVLEVLSEVDEAFRAPLMLFYVEDLSYLDIAETLGVPIGTVMSRLSRGKVQLRARLAAREQASNVIPFNHEERRRILP